MHPVSSTVVKRQCFYSHKSYDTHHEVELSCNVRPEKHQWLPQHIMQIEGFDGMGKSFQLQECFDMCRSDFGDAIPSTLLLNVSNRIVGCDSKSLTHHHID
jgi:hypothetical protein